MILHRPGHIFVLATFLMGSMSAMAMSKSINVTPSVKPIPISDPVVEPAAETTTNTNTNVVVTTDTNTVSTNNNTGVSRIGNNASFDGVIDIFSIGPKTTIVEGAGEDAVVQVLPEEGYTKARCQGEKNCIALKWNDFVVTNPATDTLVKYKVFKSERPNVFVSSNYLETAGATPELVDTAIEPGKTYYYQIRAILERQQNNRTSLVTVAANPAPYSYFKVVAAPENMAYVSRWSVNQEICGLMNRPVDPANNFRCEFNGAGAVFADGQPCLNSDGSYPYVGQEKCYYDIGRDYLADRFARGAAPTYADKDGKGACSWHGMTASAKDQSKFTYDCIANGSPIKLNIRPQKAGVVFFDRELKAFYVAQERDWGEGDERFYWAAITPDAGVFGNKAHQSSLGINYTQNQAFQLCQANKVTVGNVDYQGRLLRKNEAFALSAFDQQNVGDIDGVNVASIDALEHAGEYGLCHTQSEHGVEVSNAYVKGSETFPSFSYELRHFFQTGSTATKNCVSKYGLQDMVGNGAYYLAEQIREGGKVADASEAVPYKKFPSDVAASFLAPLAFDNVVLPAPENYDASIIYQSVASYPYFNVALGLPFVCDQQGVCASDDKLISLNGASDAAIQDVDARGAALFYSALDIDQVMWAGCAGLTEQGLENRCGRFSTTISGFPRLEKEGAVRCVFPLE